MKKWIMTICLMVVLTVLVGCASTIDPATGEKLYAVDPNAVASLQEMGEAASVVLSILGVFWPFLLPIAGYVGGSIRASKKLSPLLTKFQTEAQMYHTAALSTALGIEEFKKEFPKEWAELEKKLVEIKSDIINPEDRVKIENIIRGLRGLPPKE